jgi:hypothetical protein
MHEARIMFVHGTGVRNDATSVLNIIAPRLADYFNPCEVKACLWGTSVGSKLLAGGLSIPPDIPNSEDEERACLWEILTQDPLFELRLISETGLQDSDFTPPNAESWLNRWESMKISKALQGLLSASGLEDAFWDARNFVFNSDLAAPVFAKATSSSVEPALMLARAVIARMCQLSVVQRGIALDRRLSEVMVDQLLMDFDAKERGIGDWFLGLFGGLAASSLTTFVEKRRSTLYESAAPIPGDILFYLSRGESIRNFVIDEIHSFRPTVIVAHSLGGIASFESLLIDRPGSVTHFITMGSQISLLYELDCLSQLRYGEPIPDIFPHWLNLYDRRDLLSFICSSIFGRVRVQDVEIESGLHFPASHSAYWTNHVTWTSIGRFLSPGSSLKEM